VLIKVAVKDDRLVIYTPKYKMRFRLTKSGRMRDTMRYDGKYVDVVFLNEKGEKMPESALPEYAGRVTFRPIEPRNWFWRLIQRVRMHFQRQALKELEWSDERKEVKVL